KNVYCEALYAEDLYLQRFIERIGGRIEGITRRISELAGHPPSMATETARQTLGLQEKRLRDSRVELWQALADGKHGPRLAFIGEWNRRKLDIGVGTYDLDIMIPRWPHAVLWQFRAGVEHP